MKWMVPILPINYDVHRAFSVGEFLDIKQIAPFQVGDTVYVISTDKEEIGYFYYECTVDKVQIDPDYQVYFEPYYQYSGQVELLEFLVRLKLARRIYHPGHKDLAIGQFGFTTIPSKPIRNIGEQKKLFEELETVLQKVETEDPSIKHIEESVYAENQQKFVRLFPADQWNQVSVEQFMEHRQLLIHELSELLDRQDVILLELNQGKYSTSISRVSDIQAFFEQLRNDIHDFLQDKESPLLDLFPWFKLGIQSFYKNTTMFAGEELNQITKVLELDHDDMVEVNREISELIRKGNPTYEHANAWQLSQFIIEKLDIKVKSLKKVVLEKQPFSYYSKEDENEIERLLRKYKKMFITRINHFGGVDELKHLLNRIFGGKGAYLSSLASIEKKRLGKNLEYYVLLEDTTLSYNLVNTFMNLENNIHVVVYSTGNQDKMNLDLRRYFLSKFIFFKPSVMFNEEDIITINKRGVSGVVSQRFIEKANEINRMIDRTSLQPVFITRDVFAMKQEEQGSLSDIIKYQIHSILISNEFNIPINIDDLMEELMEVLVDG